MATLHFSSPSFLSSLSSLFSLLFLLDVHVDIPCYTFCRVVLLLWRLSRDNVHIDVRLVFVGLVFLRRPMWSMLNSVIVQICSVNFQEILLPVTTPCLNDLDY